MMNETNITKLSPINQRLYTMQGFAFIPKTLLKQ